MGLEVSVAKAQEFHNSCKRILKFSSFNSSSAVIAITGGKIFRACANFSCELCVYSARLNFMQTQNVNVVDIIRLYFAIVTAAVLDHKSTQDLHFLKAMLYYNFISL